MIEGFDYTIQKPLRCSRQDWSARLARAARRKVEKNETFAFDERGLLLFEVYANIQASPTEEPDWLS